MVPVGQYIGGILTLTLGSAQVPFLIAGTGTILVGALMLSFRKLRRLGFEPSSQSGSLPAEPPPPTTGVPLDTAP
jgi:hypothetical protein